MQVSELVRATSVPLATVKYYLREGLLPAGAKVTSRSSTYDERHVRRLTLLRVLREVGAIPVSRLRELVEAAEDTRLSVHGMFGRATDAVAAADAPALEPSPTARELADRAITRAGWDAVRPGAVDRDNLARVLTQLESTGLFEIDGRVLAFYAGYADDMAAREIAALPDDPDRTAQLERMVVGTVVYGEVLAIMRRLAEEHHSAARFDRPVARSVDTGSTG